MERGSQIFAKLQDRPFPSSEEGGARPILIALASIGNLENPLVATQFHLAANSSHFLLVCTFQELHDILLSGKSFSRLFRHIVFLHPFVYYFQRLT